MNDVDRSNLMLEVEVEAEVEIEIDVELLVLVGAVLVIVDVLIVELDAEEEENLATELFSVVLDVVVGCKVWVVFDVTVELWDCTIDDVVVSMVLDVIFSTWPVEDEDDELKSLLDVVGTVDEDARGLTYVVDVFFLVFVDDNSKRELNSEGSIGTFCCKFIYPNTEFSGLPHCS